MIPDMQDYVNTHAKKLATDLDSTFNKKWINSQFKDYKIISTTEKGTLGEILLGDVLKKCGCQIVDVPKGRRGQYDVGFKGNMGHVRFEVKVATEDTSGAFQFNGVRHDTMYTHLFCIGVSPNIIRYIIVPKQDLSNGTVKLVSMAKGSNAQFKLTLKADKLFGFDGICEILRLL